MQVPTALLGLIFWTRWQRAGGERMGKCPETFLHLYTWAEIDAQIEEILTLRDQMEITYKRKNVFLCLNKVKLQNSIHINFYVFEF